MRRGERRNTVSALRELSKRVGDIAADIERAPLPDLYTIGSAWMVDGRVCITLGDVYELSVMEARVLVARLVAAIYCCKLGGNVEDAKCQAREEAFLDALKEGLCHALTREQIQEAIAPHERGG